MTLPAASSENSVGLNTYNQRKGVAARGAGGRQTAFRHGKEWTVEFGMDTWKYHDITHKDGAIMNPVRLSKMKELIDILWLPDGDRILDSACGKAAFLGLAVETGHGTLFGGANHGHRCRQTDQKSQAPQIQCREKDPCCTGRTPRIKPVIWK